MTEFPSYVPGACNTHQCATCDRRYAYADEADRCPCEEEAPAPDDTWVAEQQRAMLSDTVETLRTEIRKIEALLDEHHAGANTWEIDAWYTAKTALRNAIHHMTGVKEFEGAPEPEDLDFAF